jgi:hypothetical protein
MCGDKGGEGFNLICIGAPRVHWVTSLHKSRLLRHADDVSSGHFLSLNPLSLKRLKHASHFHLKEVPFDAGVLWIAGILLHCWQVGGSGDILSMS